MEYLEAMSLCMYALDEVMHAGKRDQVNKSRIDEIKVTVIQIRELLSDQANNIDLGVALEKTLRAIKATDSLDMLVLPDTIKDIIIQALGQLKRVIARICFDYYSINKFEDDEEVIPVMREVVKSVIGGSALG